MKALALLLLAAGLAHADNPSPGSDPGFCESLRTINATGNAIWVTVYDAGHLQHLDWGWVDPCSVRVWRSGNYACGSFYHVRAEVKPWDTSQANVFDTQVEFNPQGLNYSSWVVTLRRSGTSNNYYWEHGNTAGCTPTGVTSCCKDYQPAQGDPFPKPPPRPPSRVDFTFDNATKTYAQVHIYFPGVKHRRTGSILDGIDDTDNQTVHDECVSPETKKTWNLEGAFEYRMMVTPHIKSCDGEKKLRGQGTRIWSKGSVASVRLERDDEHRSVKLVDTTK